MGSSNSKSDAAEAEAQRLQGLLITTRSKLQTAQADISRLESEKKSIEVQLRAKADGSSDAQRRADQVEAHDIALWLPDAASSDCHDQDPDHDLVLEEAVSQLAEERDRLKGECTVLETQVRSKTEMLSEMQFDLRQQDTTIVQLRKESVALQRALDSARTDMKALQQQAANAAAEVAAATVAAAAAPNAPCVITAAHDSAVAGQIEGFTAQLQQQEALLSTTKANLAEACFNLAAMQQQLEDAQSQVHEAAGREQEAVLERDAAVRLQVQTSLKTQAELGGLQQQIDVLAKMLEEATVAKRSAIASAQSNSEEASRKASLEKDALHTAKLAERDAALAERDAVLAVAVAERDAAYMATAAAEERAATCSACMTSVAAAQHTASLRGAELDTALADARAEMDTLRRAMAERDEALAAAAANVERSHALVAAEKARRSRLEEEVVILMEAASEAEQRWEQAARSSRDVERQQRLQLEALTTAVAGKSETISRLQAELAQSTDQGRQQAAFLGALQSQLANKSYRITSLQSQVQYAQHQGGGGDAGGQGGR